MKFEEVGEAIQERISQRQSLGEGVSIKDVAMGILGGALCSSFTFGLLTLVMWGI